MGANRTVINARAAILPIELERAGGAGTSWHYDEVAAAIVAAYDPRRETRGLRVLEAGGGSASHLPLPIGAEVTTIDISAEQIAANTYATHKLVGDLQTFDYGERRYDLIIAWDVLEHLERPNAALERFMHILAPSGRLLVVGPQRYTLKGLITRLSPHGLHVAFYRYVLGSHDAGKPGHPPFPAHLASGAEPLQLATRLQAGGLLLDKFVGYESSHVGALSRKSPLLIACYRAAEWLLHVATLGRYTRGMTDFFLIARKPG